MSRKGASPEVGKSGCDALGELCRRACTEPPVPSLPWGRKHPKISTKITCPIWIIKQRVPTKYHTYWKDMLLTSDFLTLEIIPFFWFKGTINALFGYYLISTVTITYESMKKKHLTSYLFLECLLLVFPNAENLNFLFWVAQGTLRGPFLRTKYLNPYPTLTPWCIPVTTRMSAGQLSLMPSALRIRGLKDKVI